MRFDLFGNFDQEQIARMMPQGIVDLFEAVQVHHQECKRLTHPLGAPAFSIKGAQNRSQIGQPGQTIRIGCGFGFFVLQGVGNGVSSQSGNGLDQANMFAGIFLEIAAVQR